MSLMKERKWNFFLIMTLWSQMCHRRSQNKVTASFPLPPLSLFTTRQPNPHCRQPHTYVRVLPFWRENPVDQSEAGSRCSQPMAMYRMSRWEAGFSPPPNMNSWSLGHKHGSSKCNLQCVYLQLLKLSFFIRNATFAQNRLQRILNFENELNDENHSNVLVLAMSRMRSILSKKVSSVR